MNTKELKMLLSIWSDCKYPKQRDDEIIKFVEEMLKEQKKEFEETVKGMRKKMNHEEKDMQGLYWTEIINYNKALEDILRAIKL